MDPYLIIAYKLARLSPRPFGAVFSGQIAESDLAAMFSPWRWLTVKLDSAKTASAPACTARTERGDVLLDGGFPTNAMDLDLIQEISHHDFEIGGKNLWDGAPTCYAPFILRALSRIHCRDYFPNPVMPELRELRAALDRPIETLDIGCGPISWLRWGAIEGLVTVTGVDPLIEVYQVILARHGLLTLPFITPKKMVAAGVETLTGREHRQAYEFVFTNNALDHVQDIRKAMSCLHGALSPKGIAYVQVATNEGTRQNWEQLHQHDIDLDGNWLSATRKSGERYRLAGPGCALEIQKIVYHDTEGLTVVLTKA
jgi:2-polyprenyl-3-methyl-5-hydroxy-6-metoxy-1,4-benzoquinol methylase